MNSIIVTLALIVLALIFKKSKLLSVLFFLFMWTLWGWNAWNGDYEAYKILFDSTTSISDLSNYEVGYGLINLFINSLGINFQGFMIFLSFITLFIVMIFCLKYSKYPALFAALYFIIFIMEYVFLRNYLAHSLLILALMVAFEEIRNYKVWFVVIILIASSIHSSAFLFLFFVYSLYCDKIISLKKAIPFFAFLVLLSIVLFKAILPLFGINALLRFDMYATDGGFSNVFFAHLIIVILMYFYIKMVINNSEILSPQHIRIFTIVVNINIISLVYLSVYYHVPYFARILRFIFAFDFIFLLSSFYYVSKIKIKIFMGLLFICIFSALVVLFLKSTLLLTLYPIYLCNFIWGVQIIIPDM